MNQRRYQKRIAQINKAFSKNLMAHPKQASKAFDKDLGSTIRKYNASQLRQGFKGTGIGPDAVNNRQSNRQASSGSATNQNRVTGNQGGWRNSYSRGGFDRSYSDRSYGRGGMSNARGVSRYRHLPGAVGPTQGGSGIERSPLHFPQKGGPAGGKPYVNGGPRGHFFDDYNAHGPLPLGPHSRPGDSPPPTGPMHLRGDALPQYGPGGKAATRRQVLQANPGYEIILEQLQRRRKTTRAQSPSRPYSA